ncbi:MAG: hypothetical protein JWN95_2761 [Frankiales bacterium]|nr:hypothetical protein [Frankiales bacterium]
MLVTDDPAITVGDFVGTDAECCSQRARQLHHEAARTAVRRGLLGHRSVRAAVAVVPPLGRVVASEPREHPDAADAQFEGDLVDLLIVSVQVTRDQARVVRGRRQQITGAQVAAFDPFVPWHPGRREHRRFAGQQHDLGHRRVVTRHPAHRDRPIPAAVAELLGRESVGHRVFGFGPDTQVFPDGVSTEVNRRRPRKFDRAGADFVEGHVRNSGEALDGEHRKGRHRRAVQVGSHTHIVTHRHDPDGQP